MKVCSRSSFGVLAAIVGVGAAVPTWPSSIDELEDVMFLMTGYRSRGFSAHVTPCGFSEFGPGRQTAAEWLRIGFHDMSTANVYNAPHGGIDASMMFELNDGENIGAGLNTSLITYGGLYNSELSVADLIALGVYTSVRACGGPVIPMRGGRVDATKAGPIGVPQPQNGRGTFTNQFLRMGFNTTEMIQMTACGHTLGGVHAGNFPNIVAPGTATNDFQLFDNSVQFDNAIATRYIDGPTTDPLAGALAASSGRDSDNAVFGADGNVTVKAMTNAAIFNSMCSTILQKMIEVVDPTIVTLSDIITPYAVKPYALQLTLSSSGSTLTFSGEIRVDTTTLSVDSVTLTYKDRTGGTGGSITTGPVSQTVSGVAAGLDNSFTFYGFSQNISSTASISSFTVAVKGTDGTTTTYSNNGAGFLVQDSVVIQMPQSCYKNGEIKVVAAVRNTVTSAVNLGVTTKVARSGIPVPALSNSTATLVKGPTVGPYTLYSGSLAAASTTGTKFGVTSGAFSDSFKDASNLGSSCSAAGGTTTSSTSISSTTSETSTSSSSSASATPTLTHKQKVGAYTFQGCYTEATGARALTGSSYVDYKNMTIEMCASNCAGSTYFGVEYGGECYCGSTLDSTSTLATLSDCSFTCPGNAYEYCGAGNRLEMYKVASASTTSTTASSSSSSKPASTSVSVSSTKSSSSSSVTVSGSSTSKSSSVSVTSTSSSVAPTGTLGVKATVGSYSFMGCYTEGNGVRALSSASFYNYDTMTLESCSSSCSSYAYFGVEYGGECYCGDSIDPSSTVAAAGDCSFVCPGDKFEYCGAGNRLEMYKKGSVQSVASTTTTSSSKSPSSTSKSSTLSTSTTKSSTSSKPSSISKSSSSTKTSSVSASPSKSSTTTSTSSATPTPTGPAIKKSLTSPSGTTYTYLGCYTEGSTTRALTSAAYYNYTTMTLESCASSCSSPTSNPPYKYFGVEYGGECYCGNAWSAGAVLASGGDGECSFTCPGDGSEYCGAGNRLSAYSLAAS